jgi:hypothetical protein
LTADVITQIFGVRRLKRLRGKLLTMLEKLDDGHHVLRVYCKKSRRKDVREIRHIPPGGDLRQSAQRPRTQ